MLVSHTLLAKDAACLDRNVCDRGGYLAEAFIAVEEGVGTLSDAQQKLYREVLKYNETAHHIVRHRLVKLNDNALLSVKALASDVLSEAIKNDLTPSLSDSYTTYNLTKDESLNTPINLSLNFFEDRTINRVYLKTVTTKSSLIDNSPVIHISAKTFDERSDYFLSMSFREEKLSSLSMASGYSYALKHLDGELYVLLVRYTRLTNDAVAPEVEPDSHSIDILKIQNKAKEFNEKMEREREKGA